MVKSVLKVYVPYTPICFKGGYSDRGCETPIRVITPAVACAGSVAGFGAAWWRSRSSRS
jgi:hypothetical protein